MKNILITIIGVALLTSCGNSGNQINSAEGLKEIKNLVEESFGEDKEIYSFSLKAKDHLTSEMGQFRIGYLEDGVDYSRYYNTIFGSGNELQDAEKADESFQKEFFLKSKQGKIKLKDINYNLIQTKYEEAIKLISEKYTDFTLYKWEYEVANDGSITADFTIEATKEGEATSMQGRNIVTNYYEFPFKMNADQSLEYKED